MTVFTEDFENVANPALGQFLNTYTGAAPLAMTYTANPSWISGPACNGIIASYNSTVGTTGCAYYNSYIRPLARGMGAALGGGDNNQVMADVTVAGYPAPATPAATLETVGQIPLPATGRFITFSVAAGAVSCNAPAPPLLRFFLLDGANAIPASSNAINACTDPRGTVVSGVRVGTYPSDASNLVSNNQIGVRLTNDQTSGSGNDYAVDNIRVLDATPQLDKVFGADTVSGVPSTLAFTITNTNDLAAKRGWSFTDTLPAGLVVASPAAAGTNCNTGAVTAPSGGGTIQVSGNLLAGQTSCVATVSVVSPAPGSFQNCPANLTAVVGLDLPACDSLTVAAASDLRVTKSGSPIVVLPGGTVIYTLNVLNNGPDASPSVTLTDTLPSGVDYVSNDSGCSAAALPLITCNLGPLASGAGATVQITGQVQAGAGGTTQQNTASVTGPNTDLVPANNSSNATTLVPPLSDLSVQKGAAPSPVRAGQQLTYTIAANNAGPTASNPTVVTDTLPAGLTYVSDDAGCNATAAPVITCDIGSLGAASSQLIHIVTQVDLTTRGPIQNTVTIDGPNNDQDPTNNSDQISTQVDPPSSDLSVTKTPSGTGPFNVGDQVAYTFVVTNNGPDDEPQAVVTDTLPAGLTYVSNDAGCDASALPTLSCDLGPLASGATRTFTMVAQVNQAAGSSVTNTASVSGANDDPSPGNNAAAVSSAVLTPAPAQSSPAGLAISKRTGAGIVHPGSVVGYEITVRNNRKGDAQQVKVCDRLPQEQVSLRAPGAKLVKRNKVCWRLKELKAGKKRSFSITTQVRLSAPAGSQRNVAVATAANVNGKRTDDAEVTLRPAADSCAAFGPARLFPGPSPGIQPRC